MDKEGTTYTYNELCAFVEVQWDTMCEEEKHLRLAHVDPTFEQYVLSCIKKGQSVFIDNVHTDYTII